MSYNNDNTDDTFIAKRTNPRYINITEDILDVLDCFSLKVYMTLRFEADYSSDCSPFKRNIQFIVNKTKLSRRQIFLCLNELENQGLLKRESNPGYQSIYLIAQHLNHFSKPPPAEPERPPKEIDQTPVHDVHGVVHDVHGVVHHMHNISINSSTNKSIRSKTLVDLKKSTSYKEDDFFMKFYSVYPNKQKPEVARKAFYKLNPTEELLEYITSDVISRCENNWFGRPKDKIPHPSTYLNGKEWEGDLYPPESTISTKSTNSSNSKSYHEYQDQINSQRSNTYDNTGRPYNALR